MIDIHEVESRSRVNDADLRVRRTRKLLKDALTELWSEKSFDSITVQDIAERAMVNRATFYLHFQDKYTLFDQVGRDKFHQLVAKRLPEAASFNRNNLRSLVLTTMETLEGISRHACRGARASASECRSLVLASVQGGLHDYIYRRLKHVPAYHGQPPEAIEAAAASLSWAIFGAGMTWSRGSTLPAEQMADQVAMLLADGLLGVLASNLPTDSSIPFGPT